MKPILTKDTMSQPAGIKQQNPLTNTNDTIIFDEVIGCIVTLQITLPLVTCFTFVKYHQLYTNFFSVIVIVLEQKSTKIKIVENTDPGIGFQAALQRVLHNFVSR